MRLSAAFGLLVAIAIARAPFTQVSDALFVSDGFGYYIWLPTVVIDGDLDLANQLPRLPYEGEKHFFTVSAETGMHRNQFPIGSAICWAPFFLAADAGVMGLNALGTSIERSGFGWCYELPVYVGAFAYGLSSIWLMQKTLRQLFSKPVADLGLCAVVFATPLAYYLWFEPNMSHSVALFSISLWIYLLLRIHTLADLRIRSWLLLGAALGLVALIRPYNGILGIVAIPVAYRVAAAQGVAGVRAYGVATLRLGVCCLVAIAAMAPQFYVWNVLYGKPLVVPDSSGYQEMAWWSPDIVEYLSSVVIFTPYYLVAVAGLVLACIGRRGSIRPVTEDCDAGGQFARTIAAPSLVVLVLIGIFIAASRDWALGTAFGQRRMCDWSLLLAMGACLVLPPLTSRTSPRFVGGAAAVLIAANLGLVLLYVCKRLPEYGIVFG